METIVSKMVKIGQFGNVLNMIEKERLKALVEHFRLTQKAFGDALKISKGKVSKVLSGEQTLPDKSIAEIFIQFKVHPNWLFGYEGDPNTPVFLNEMVHKSEFEKVQKENYEIRVELGEAYKQLAAERKTDYNKEDAQVEQTEGKKEVQNL